MHPRVPAFADRFCVAVNVVFFSGCFEQWPEKRQRKKTPIHVSERRFYLKFCLFLAARSITDRQSNRDSDPQCAENGRHGVFAHEIFSALTRASRLLLCLVP